MTKRPTYSVWVLLRAAEDLPGQWVAHLLDFDVVSQGNSIMEALRMVVEATGIVLADDLAKGLDPHLRRAPDAYWEELWSIVRTGEPNGLGDLVEEEGDLKMIATPMELFLQAPLEPSFTAPAAFLKASA